MVLIIGVSLCVLVFSVYYYFKLRPEENNLFIKKGISSDYKVFIDLVLLENKPAKLMTTKEHSFQLAGPKVSFSLSRVQDKVIIVWTWSSAEFGQRGKEWSFPYQHDQAKMYAQLKEDIDAYKASIYQNYNLLAPVKDGRSFTKRRGQGFKA